jgi:hypothetical protein
VTESREREERLRRLARREFDPDELAALREVGDASEDGDVEPDEASQQPQGD